MRDRSICSPRWRAIRSTHSSTAESIPSPSRSIFRKPASAHESLSHWHICRPAIAAGCTGTSSTSGRVEITIPPGCCEMWRGRPAISVHSSANARQRGERELLLRVRQRATSSATRAAFQPSVSVASRSRSANGRPSALPTSRIAPRERYVEKVATSAACSRPYFSVTRTISFSRMSRGKSRSMSGTDDELAVEEAAEREVRRDRVDVREPGQVADERADGGAAAAARRQHVPHRARPAHLERDLARELEHLPVQQEEAGEAELVDQRELLVEPRAHAPLVAVQPGVALGERALADAAELDDRRLVAVGEVGIAVAELLASGRTRAARRARRCARPRRGRPGSARACRRARRARTRGCRAARARSRRARCGSGSRRARPAARRGARRARARRRWRPSARASVSARSRSAALRRASPRSYGRCSSTKKRSRPKTPASRAAAFGSRTASPCRAQPERQTSPSLQLLEQRRSRAPAAAARVPPSAASARARR